jgi:isopenicillin N synthase-like dioxygenase
MIGTAGVVNGKLQLSQGISRPISTGFGGQFTKISIIDLPPMTNVTATAEENARLISEIYDACTRVGFFIATSHGVDWNIIDKAFDGSKEFFDLLMEKMEVSQDKSASYQGYVPPYYTNVGRL